MPPSIYSWLLAATLAVCALPSQAMTVQIQGNLLFAGGPVGDDLRLFEEAFAKGGVDTVEFVNSPGGDLWTGLRVGRLIAEKGYNTVVAGGCVSACSIMFMGGKERRFSDAFRPGQTLIGIHGAHNIETKQVITTLQPQIFAFYKLRTGDKFNSQVINQALYEMEDAGALLRVFDPVRSPKTPPYHCASSQTPRTKCTTLTGTDAASLGLVTHNDLVKLDLPSSFSASPSVMGKPLDILVPDLPAYYAELAKKQCRGEPCQSATLKRHEQGENRAVATPLSGPGYGFSFNADSPMMALVRAVYSCNHDSKRPVALCEPQVVNQYDVRPLYSAAPAAHAAARAQLKVPADKFYANEEFGGGFTTATGFRTQKLSDITPTKLDGVKVVGTQELVRALLSAQAPTVVDVMGLFETIPQSLALLGAGAALENPTQDAELQKRIGALLALLAPDPSAPVVFFCAGRSCWQAVNAALRATQLGYTQVQWYRGGMESWVAAGLPTAGVVLRAVAR
jgi:rhodanese-related sulfurtransferase